MNKVGSFDVSTARNQAVFYLDPGNRALTEQFAKENGKIYLEQTPGGNWLDNQKLFDKRCPLTTEQAKSV